MEIDLQLFHKKVRGSFILKKKLEYRELAIFEITITVFDNTHTIESDLDHESLSASRHQVCRSSAAIVTAA